MTATPHIALVTARDPADRRAWSGLHHHIARALARHVGRVTALGPTTPAILPFLRRVDGFAQRHGRTRYNVHHGILLARAYAAFFADGLARGAYDLVFAPAASTEIAYLRTPLPIVYLSDATVAAMIGYYPNFSGLCRLSRLESNHIERRAIGRAAALIYASDWAARSAMATYAAPAERIRVIPFGANLDDPPSRAQALAARDDARCRLLFVGRDWQRKGADIACATLRHLRQTGIDAELTICGCRPPAPVDDPHVRVVPFLNQNVPAEREALTRLYLEATVFLLPTRAECSGVVFCEASAFALPIVATDTGGVATIVQEGRNGRLLPPDARAPDYARVIRELLGDPVAFAALRESSRLAFEARLNWDAWGRSVRDVVDGLVGSRARRAPVA